MKPFTSLDKNNECAKRQYCFYHTYCRVCSIHSAKCFGHFYWKNINQYMYQHQPTNKRIEPFAWFCINRLNSRKQVSNEDNHQNSHKRNLWYHVKELTIIYIHHESLFVNRKS